MKKLIFAVGMKRFALLAPVLLLTTLTTAAQEERPSGLVRLGLDYLKSLTAPKKHFDSTYVLQPVLKWTVSLESALIHTRADLFSDLTITDLTGDQSSILHGTMETGMQSRPSRKVGLAAGYGSLHLGYGVDLGKKKEDRNTYYSFGVTSSAYGAQIHYYKTHQLPRGTLDIEGSNPLDLSSSYPGELRNLTLNGFYAFNRHRFVYSAAYNGRILQRRSAGSWMVTAKYVQGDFSLNPADDLWNRLNDLRRYSTQQVSVGGGYSFNWVILHRDPTDPATAAGLRNLTVNVTALPMISFLNHIQTEQNRPGGLFTVRYKGQPAFTPTLSSGINWSLGRVCFNVSAEYSRFGFEGVETMVEEQNGFYKTNVKTRGTFHDISVKGKVDVRF
jgi:hypothetical protein